MVRTRPTTRQRGLLVATAASLVVLSACSSTASTGSAVPLPPAPVGTTSSGANTTGGAPATQASTRRPTTPTTPATAHKLLVIVEENESAVTAYPAMPYLTQLSKTYARVDDYRAVSHPSLPNYLAMSGGSTFGVTDDNSPASHPISGSSMFGQAVAANKTAKVYAEDMPANCATSSSGNYAVRHTGWPYYRDERAACQKYDVPMGSTTGGALATDAALGSLPDVGWAIPNVCNDAHSCPLSTADGWLQRWVPQLMASPDYTSGRLVIVITFDEGNGSDQQVPFVVVARDQHALVVQGSYTHYSLVRLCDELLGVNLLRNAAGAADLRAPLHL